MLRPNFLPILFFLCLLSSVLSKDRNSNKNVNLDIDEEYHILPLYNRQDTSSPQTTSADNNNNNQDNQSDENNGNSAQSSSNQNENNSPTQTNTNNKPTSSRSGSASPTPSRSGSGSQSSSKGNNTASETTSDGPVQTGVALDNVDFSLISPSVFFLGSGNPLSISFGVLASALVFVLSMLL
ncbi:hypothetical protein BB559_002407 [Furculomyces boomerangus]|uniref:Uncharacterized protein n=1 Tax=Furculomyces boomerangus TaxID=61424 RepID=A0A2T9YVJ5_9FUNG|nr:hypothetical protein BB559_002407 [Furculomyces boomerangus]